MTDITWTWYWNRKVTCVISLGGAVRRAGVCRGQLVTQHFRSHFRTWKLSKTSQKRFPDAPASKSSNFCPKHMTYQNLGLNETNVWVPSICHDYLHRDKWNVPIEVVISICHIFWPKLLLFKGGASQARETFFGLFFLSFHLLKYNLANLVSI